MALGSTAAVDSTERLRHTHHRSRSEHQRECEELDEIANLVGGDTGEEEEAVAEPLRI